MIVMPANNVGFFVHCLARETARIGHLYSPGQQRGPWPWLPYAMDNGAFSCWDMKTNTFNEDKWQAGLPAWREMLWWGQTVNIRPRWAIVPDVPGNASATFARWEQYAHEVKACNIPLALAVQDGMVPDRLRWLTPQPDVLAIGGTTGFKWNTVEQWAKVCDRVHVLRVNAPDKLEYLEKLGIESCDGTGWVRGDRNQTAGLERWARKSHVCYSHPLAPHTCRN